MVVDSEDADTRSGGEYRRSVSFHIFTCMPFLFVLTTGLTVMPQKMYFLPAKLLWKTFSWIILIYIL